MAWNKHEWTSKGILFHFVSIPFFKLKSPNVNLFSCLVCLSDKMADLPLCLARLPANQTPGEGSIKHFLKKCEWFVQYTCVQNRKTHTKNVITNMYTVTPLFSYIHIIYFLYDIILSSFYITMQHICSSNWQRCTVSPLAASESIYFL